VGIEVEASDKIVMEEDDMKWKKWKKWKKTMVMKMNKITVLKIA
jgi:hypothetical protein